MTLRMRRCLLPSSSRPVILSPGVSRHAKSSSNLFSNLFFSSDRVISKQKCPISIRKHVRLPPVSILRYSTSPGPSFLQDSIRPSIFYHLVEAPNSFSQHLPAYAVSLLKKPPAKPRSPSVMGWLLAASTEDNQEAGIQDFLENHEFLNVVHELLRSVAEENSDERLESEAVQLGSGWMHINDDRNLPEVGRISSPEDIIASIRVEDGKMLPETYSPIPAYRICTKDGLTTLSPGLEEKLIAKLRQLDQ